MRESTKITIIKPNRSLLDFEISEIWKFKDLIALLIRRDFVSSYKQTILGPFWVVIQALAGSAVFTVIFGNVAGIPTDGHPTFLFYLCGNMAWNYFATVFGLGSNALQTNIGLFSKVYFPRLIPPLSQAFSSLFNFFIQLLVLFFAIWIYNSSSVASVSGPSPYIYLLPLIILQSALLALGLGFIISSTSVKYRDLNRLGALLTQFIMYASPVIYPTSEIPLKYQTYLSYNPLTFIVETYRYLLLGHATGFKWEFAIPSILMTLVIFLIGLILYNRTQRNYVDYA